LRAFPRLARGKSRCGALNWPARIPLVGSGSDWCTACRRVNAGPAISHKFLGDDLYSVAALLEPVAAWAGGISRFAGAR
jgi:hypothetical protein